MLARVLGYRRERRHDRRYDAPGGILTAGGQRFAVHDLSLSGVRAMGAGHRLRPGERLAFELDLPLPARRLLVHGWGQVVWTDDRFFALRYVGLDHRLIRLVDFYLGSRRAHAPNGGVR